MEDLKEKEWFNNLTDEQKYSAYCALKEVNKSNSNTISEIVDYLLGTDYYTIASDTYGSNAEIVQSIKYSYSDANYSLGRQWAKLKTVISDYFEHL